MKKVLLIAVIALFAFSSCKKSGVNLIETIPELKGEWVWTHTVVGGVVGIIHPEPEKRLVIDFKDNNTISVKYDGETIVNSASYTCREAANTTYGKYQITLPKEVRTKVAERLGISESHIVLDGYILLDDAVDELPTADNLTLYITNVDMEGGSDFHCTSGFKPNRVVLY
jgi:hypothetical protein